MKIIYSHGLAAQPDFVSALCGCSSSRQGLPAVQKQREETAEWPGSSGHSTHPPAAAERGAQDETGPTHRQDPPAKGELSEDETSDRGRVCTAVTSRWSCAAEILTILWPFSLHGGVQLLQCSYRLILSSPEDWRHWLTGCNISNYHSFFCLFLFTFLFCFGFHQLLRKVWLLSS